jgi:hypothetical protein
LRDQRRNHNLVHDPYSCKIVDWEINDRDDAELAVPLFRFAVLELVIYIKEFAGETNVEAF